MGTLTMEAGIHRFDKHAEHDMKTLMCVAGI